MSDKELYQPTGSREADLLNAANMLMDARRTVTPIDDLPAALRPQSMDEAYWIQDEIALAYQPIGGWKVGASSPEATPTYAPMPLTFIRAGGASLRGITHPYRGLEAEVAFLIGHDLPARDQAYSQEEVLAAIASCHPAIEVLESAFVDPMKVDTLSRIADLQIHGTLVFGPACPDWRSIDFAQEHVTLGIDGTVRVQETGSNPAGDLYRLLTWLANEAAGRTQGLKVNQWVTTGSWTGSTIATACSAVDARFSTLGRVTLGFGA